jgi:succinoglycan biosynthesis protein ExoA
MIPRVTILTPAFDAARFIARAYDSVRRQTIEDWEWVVVDDASRDDTVARLTDLARIDPRVRVISSPRNGGPAAARNLGLDAARGDFVAVFDIDDLMEPWRLERLLAVAADAQADIVADDLRIAPEAELSGAGEPFLSLRADLGPQAVSLDAFLRANVLFGPPRQTGYLKPMFRRAFLEARAIRYDARLRIGEDFALVATALASGARFVIDPSIGYRYGVREGSISREMRPEDVEALLAADADLAARHPHLSVGETGAALAVRRRSFLDGLAYMRAIAALKRRDLEAAARALMRRPGSLALMRLPLLARIARLRSRAPAPPRVRPDAVVDPARVLVVIPTLNEGNCIAHVLAQLTAGDPRMRSVRVVVADGGSTDSTREKVAAIAAMQPNIALIDNPARLQSAAINRAAAAFGADADILVRCDAHAEYPATYVLDVATALLQRDVDSLVVAMDAVGGTCFQRAVAWIVDTPLGAGGAAHRGGRVSRAVDHGHHAAFRMRRFLELGGYDETFSHNEDAEYDRRLHAAGGRIFLEAGVRKIYHPRATVAALWRQYRNYGAGRARTLLKHGGRPALRQMIPVINLAGLAGALALAPLAPITLAAPGVYLGALALASIATAILRRSPCGLGAGAALAVIHNAWAIGFIETVARSGSLKRPGASARPHVA